MFVLLGDGRTGPIERLEVETGIVYDMSGRKVRTLQETTEIAGPHGQGLPVQALSDYAAERYYRNYQDQLGGQPMKVMTRERGDRTVLMDLAVGDVHKPTILSNFAGGYHLAQGVADLVSPPILTPKQSDYYAVWNQSVEFKRAMSNATSPGGAVPEVNPSLSTTQFTAAPFALAAFVPTEVESNADAPLRPFQKAVSMVMDKILLEREIRVAQKVQTSANWTSANVQALAAGAQWNGGASSDPVANLHTAIENSYLDVTDIIFSELVDHDWSRNPAVQKYVGFKDKEPGISASSFSSTLNLPPIHVARMKYISAGALTYVWGNHVVLIHKPAEQPPTSQQDIATSYTFRWNGGMAPDGTMTAGFLVRTFYDPKRGPRGGTQVIVAHNDSEQMTSTIVGGLILNAHR